jgi:hypothetical protein
MAMPPEAGTLLQDGDEQQMELCSSMDLLGQFAEISSWLQLAIAAST